jgi:hypothetical protein
MLPTDFQHFFVKYLYIIENGKYLLNFPEFKLHMRRKSNSLKIHLLLCICNNNNPMVGTTK